MILLQLLDHDLHRTRSGTEATPLYVETPASLDFLPAVISASRPDKYYVARHLTKDNKIRSGIFEYDSDRVDELLGGLIAAAYDLSVASKWDNIFESAEKAHEYVRSASDSVVQPHVLLIPTAWTPKRLVGWAGKDNVVFPEKDGASSPTIVYRKTTRIRACNVAMPVFCSRSDYVGLYTQFLGGRMSIILHNVRRSFAFCPLKSRSKISVTRK